MKFYLGTPDELWLTKAKVPLFISHRRFEQRRTTRRKPLPRAEAEWALDSGGFTQLSTVGSWDQPAAVYAERIQEYADLIGNLNWAAPQDWMCEPAVRATTGLTVYEHQQRTIENFCELRSLTPLVIPVLQGWEINDYLRCIDLYTAAGVRLESEPVVGVGSVCRRQSTSEIETLFYLLHQCNLSLHGFGVKTAGLHRYASYLTSADSMAWSLWARRESPLPVCTHKKCNHCLVYARQWRAKVLNTISHRTPMEF